MFRSMFLLRCFILLLVLTGCKNELQLNAPYKELPSIYAVLNPQEKTQVIRINKVFLGEGDAGVMAKVADSVNYPAGELTVSLTRFVNGVQADVSPQTPGDRTIVFNEKVDSNIREGAFSRVQRLWVSDRKLFTNGQYRLEVKNNRTGNVFTARAEAIDSIRGNFFRPLTLDFVYPYPPGTMPDEYIDYSTNNGSVIFTPNSAKLYQVMIRTHFFDSSAAGKRFDYVDYEFGTREEKTKTIQGNISLINVSFRNNDYWVAVGLALAKKNLTPNIYGRKVFMIEYFVYATTQEYIDFMQFSAPSFALTQNSPLYSNFDERAALGIFTFRSRYSVKKQPASTMVNEFSRNANTCEYRFFNSASPPEILGCQF